MHSLHPAVFLDRDGTLIPDHGYLDTVAGVTLLPGVGPALRRLADAGFLLVLITNQSGIGRGYFTRELVDAQHRCLAERLAPFGVTLAGIEVCPHGPDTECDCRKPRPGMLRKAARELNVDLARSFMAGDKPGDVAAGRAAGCRTLFIGRAAACPEADHCAPTLAAAVDWMLAPE